MYKKDIKQNQNKPMETTAHECGILFLSLAEPWAFRILLIDPTRHVLLTFLVKKVKARVKLKGDQVCRAWPHSIAD